MKQGWEIKKLGEIICEHSVRNKQDYDYPVYSVTNSAGFCRDYFSKEVASKDKKTYKIVPKGYFAYNPSRINVGSVDWQRHEDNVIVSPLYVVFGTDDTICQDYLLFYLKSSSTMALIQNHATGTVRANLKFDILSQFAISLPPIAEQEKIVAELDCLSGIIEKKKQQLKELDNLAQSIFYEMFGDPVENDKGWETKSLKNSCVQLFAGGDVPKNNFSKVKTNEHTVPIISNGVGEKALYGYTSIAKVNEACITIAGRGTIGYCEVRDVPFFPVVRLIVAIPKKERLLPIVLRNIIDAHKFKGTGGAIPQLTIPMIKDCSIILPPLSLQQDFASKIESIEKQKELIAQSIKETETLFNSRMDYYFN